MSDAAAEPPKGKKAKTTFWRQKCIDEFHLQPVPETFLKADKTGRLAKISEADDDTWERYFHYRKKHGPERTRKERTTDYSEEGTLEHDVRLSMSTLRDEFIKEAGSTEARKLLVEAWTGAHSASSVRNATFEDEDDLRSADYVCYAFSPYAIPRAILLDHDYHRRSRYYSCEFSVSWAFRLVRFDKAPAGEKKVVTIPAGRNKLGITIRDEPNGSGTKIKSVTWTPYGANKTPRLFKNACGDRIVEVDGIDTTAMSLKDLLPLIRAKQQSNYEWKLTLQAPPRPQPSDPTQEALEKRFPRNWDFAYPTVCNYDASTAREYLASNSYLDPPNISNDIEDDLWSPVENIDVSNLTPATLRRLRGWLYGSPQESAKILSDLDFLRLLFVACGSGRHFSTEKGDIGHTWFPRQSPYRDEIEANLDNEEPCAVSWLEYQCRLISGALRMVDQYYEPYDILEAKAEWGKQVLDREERSNGSDYGQSSDYEDEDQDEDKEDTRQVPWILWQRKEGSEGMRQFAGLLSALQGGGF